ncbi:hypothetical protein ACFL4G_00545 [Thermodesulfobacteriota bacterium]
MLTSANLNKKTITGIVKPFDWDDDDEELVFAVTILTEDGDEYLVDDNDLGEELLELVDLPVQATGSIEEDEEGDLLITVRHYKVLQSQ